MQVLRDMETLRARGEVFRLHAPRGSRGHEQSGSRYASAVTTTDEND
jgi:hypothetical protein